MWVPNDLSSRRYTSQKTKISNIFNRKNCTAGTGDSRMMGYSLISIYYHDRSGLLKHQKNYRTAFLATFAKTGLQYIENVGEF